jgi:dihydrodipicolinate synthase/N-acetylneuraminate lyase
VTVTAAIRGVSPVLPTPFAPDGALDRRSFARVAEHTWGLGVGSVMYPGFASEYRSLSEAERRAQLADLVRAAPPGRLVIGAVSDHATRLAAERARDYADLGAGALNILPPHLGEPPHAAVLDHLAAVLEAAAPLPVVVQYVPRETGTELTAEELAALARERPNLAAVKLECRQPGAYIRRLRELGLPTLVGNAGIDLLEALEAGAVGVQPGGGFVDVYTALWSRWGDGGRRRGDALALHRRLARHLERWWPRNGWTLAMAKAIAWRRGLIASPHRQAPGPPVSADPRHPSVAEADRFIGEFGLPPVGPSAASSPRSPA